MVLTKRFYIVTISIFVVLMTILAIGNLDYTISNAIINEHSVFARFFDIFGEIPAMGGVILGITLLYGGRNRDKKWWNILSTVISAIFITLVAGMLYFNIARYIFHEEVSDITTFAYIVVLLFTVMTITAAFYLAHNKGHKWRGLKRHAWLLIALTFSSMISVNVIKSIWARPRMRSITDVSEFKHWYEISGWSNDNELKSFPSGHTANAWVALAYVIFIPYIKNIKARTWIIIASVWGSCVALARVIQGAHFLSDVLVGSYITIFLFILFDRVFLNKKQKGDLQ